MVDPLLKAYAATVLAKDASSRYSNPNRALRNYNNIIEEAERGDMSHKEEMKQYAKKLIKDAFSDETKDTKEDPKPKYDTQSVTKKEFYNFRTEMIAEIKKLTPPPVAPQTERRGGREQEKSIYPLTAVYLLQYYIY